MTFSVHCVLVLVFVLSFSDTYAKKRVPLIHKLPSYFPQCYRNDPELSKCLLDATEKVRPYVEKGVPELRIPPFEPFMLPQVNLQQGTEVLNFKATLTNVIVHGLSKYKFSKFEFNPAKLAYSCKANIPGIQLEGEYTVDGRILVVPIKGSGTFTAKLDSCDVTLYRTYREPDSLINGKRYLIPEITNTTIDVVGPAAKLNGLFDGNELVTATANKAINDNVDVLFAEIKPEVESIINEIVDGLLLKTFVTNIPYDVLYPLKE